MNKYYILKRQDDSFYGKNDDRLSKSKMRIEDCIIYSEKDKTDFAKNWSPYFSFIEVLWNDEFQTYEFA